MKKVLLLLGLFIFCLPAGAMDKACSAKSTEYVEYVQKTVKTHWKPPSNTLGPGSYKTVVEFGITEEGTICFYRIVKYSGVSFLDSAIHSVFKEIGKLKPYPKCLNVKLITINMDFTYNVIE